MWTQTLIRDFDSEARSRAFILSLDIMWCRCDPAPTAQIHPCRSYNNLMSDDTWSYTMCVLVWGQITGRDSGSLNKRRRWENTHTQLQHVKSSAHEVVRLIQTQTKMCQRRTHMAEERQTHTHTHTQSLSTGWSNWASGDSGQIQDTLGSLVKPK